MAEVFKAKSYGVEGFEKTVVLKRILPSLAQNPLFVEMFLHEARLSVALSHANIVQVFDLGREEDTYFIAMEYVLGTDLAGVIRRLRRAGQRVPVELAVFIACEVARALDYAHRRKDAHGRLLGIVHRDISPQNVLLSFEGEVKVTDFGIAKARTTVEAEGTVRGKYAYMAPEQADGGAVDSRADLFALGVTLWETLAGQNPHAAPTKGEVLQLVRTGDRPPLREVRSDVPEELARLLDGAMSLDPAARPTTAARMYEELTAVLYTLGRRVGSADLADLLRGLRDDLPSTPSVNPADLFDDIGRDSEVIDTPSPRASETPAAQVVPHDERRDVTLLAVSVVGAAGPVGGALDPVASFAARRGAAVLAREPGDITLLFGVENPDGRDTAEAARAAQRIPQFVTLPPGARLGVALHPARLLFDADRLPQAGAERDAAFAEVRALARRGDPSLLASPGAEPQLREFYELAPREGALAVTGDRGAVRKRVVGRKEVFRQFGEILARASKGLQVVSVDGDAGVGKTRAVEEIHYRLRRMNHPVTWNLATCVSHDRDVPLSGLQVLLRELLGIVDGDGEAAMREKARRVRELGLTPDEMLAVGVVLGVVSASMESLDSASRPLRTALRKIATRLGEDQITVFAWDAAEHMDDLSATLVDDLIRNAPSARVVVLFSGRGGRPRPWDDLASRAAIHLSALDEDESRALVMQTLSLTAAPPPDLLDELWARAAGNPLALEEYLKAFVDAGAVTVRESVASWRRESVRAEVPKTLRGVVASRLASLGAAERRVLQVASVIGPRVFRQQLTETVSLGDKQIDLALAALTERGLLRDQGDGEWRFASEILLDTVYDSLTLETRRALHAAVVAVTERVFHGRLDEFAERLAHHWWEAGDRARAAQYLERAARRQLRDRAPDAAVTTLGRALDRMLSSVRPDPAQVIAAYELLGEAGQHARNVDAAIERLRLAAPYAEELGDRAALARLLTLHGRLLARRQNMPEAVRVLERALALADLLNERALRGRVVSTLGAVHVERGEFGKALRHLEEAVRIAKESGLDAEHTRALLSLSRAQAASGDRAGAAASLDEAQRGESPLVAEVTRARAEVLLLARDIPAARREATAAVEQAREQHRAVELCAALMTLAEACWRADDSPRAFAVFTEARDLADRRGLTRMHTRAEAFLAFLEGSREGADSGAARARIEAAQGALEADGFLADAIETRYLLGMLAIRGGDQDRARRLLREALTKAGAAENRAYIDDCDLALRTLAAPRRPA